VKTIDFVFLYFFFPCIKSRVEYDLTTRNQGLNFGFIIYRFLSKQTVGKLDAQHTDVQHVSSDPICFFATRLVLFCVKNILAHHMFNCNVAWFVLGIIIGLIHIAKLSSFTFWNLHIICLTKCLTRCFICLSQFNGLCLWF
jgi:hypothetical protein